MKIALGTKSELKIRAVESLISMMGFHAEISGFDVDSKVSDQPFGYEETVMGAKNRAQAAHQLLKDADFAIGIENGLIKVNALNQYYDVPCICIISSEGEETFSFGAGYLIPNWMIDKLSPELSDLGLVLQSFKPELEKDPLIYFSGGKIKREEILSQTLVIAFNQILNKSNYKEF